MTINFSLKSMNDDISTKSNMLKFLKNKLEYSKIEEIIDFTILEWKSNSAKILDNISKNFNSKVIVRSSAIGEDSFENSHAGNYRSILNINSQSKIKLKQAINSVIESYDEKNNINDNNQILIQNQSLDIITSGVVFTRTVDIGAPYYVINFEDGNSTIGVTQGSINQTIKIFKKFSSLKLNKKWKSLLNSINEIELLLDLDSLDIEFGITKLEYVSISVYDVSGKWIINIVDKKMLPGTHKLRWNGKNSLGNHVPSGNYLLVMRSGSLIRSRKILYLK